MSADQKGRAKIILGVDPGLSGALAFCSCEEPQSIIVEDMPLSSGEVDPERVHKLIAAFCPELAVIERNWGAPRGSAGFKAGAAYGAVLTLVSSMIPYHFISPRTWKAHFDIVRAGKHAALDLALSLWPHAKRFDRKCDHGRAEAALIARYGADVLLFKRETRQLPWGSRSDACNKSPQERQAGASWEDRW